MRAYQKVQVLSLRRAYSTITEEKAQLLPRWHLYDSPAARATEVHHQVFVSHEI